MLTKMFFKHLVFFFGECTRASLHAQPHVLRVAWCDRIAKRCRANGALRPTRPRQTTNVQRGLTRKRMHAHSETYSATMSALDVLARVCTSSRGAMGDIKRGIRVREGKKSAVQAAPCREEDVWVGCDSCSTWRKVSDGFEVDKAKSFF